MQPLRCLIADIPQQVLADIVQIIAEEDNNVVVVDRISNIQELPGILSRQPVDVLILGMKNYVFPPVCINLLDQFSNLLIVGLVDDGRMAAVCINDVRSHELLDVINILGRR